MDLVPARDRPSASPARPGRRAAPAVADYRVVRLLGEGNHGRFYLARPPARLGSPTSSSPSRSSRPGQRARLRARGARAARVRRRRSPYLVHGLRRRAGGQLPLRDGVLPAGLAGRARPAAGRGRRCSRALEHAARAAHALHEAGHGARRRQARQRAAHRGRRRALRPRPGPVPRPRRHADGHGPRQLGRVPRPGVIGGARPSRRTEIWALGATLHRALAGTGLYGELPDAQPLLAIRKVLGAQPQIDPALRPGEAELVRPCLAPDDGRLPTAEAVADRLAALRPWPPRQAVPARFRIVTVPSSRFVT